MTLLFFIVLVFLSALLCRWRGGGLVTLPGETSANAHTQIRRASYAVGMGLIATFLGAIWWVAPVVGIVMFLAWLTGTGRPIGAMGGWEKEPLQEWGPLDTAAEWLTILTVGDPNRNRRTWGLIWFTLWGLGVGLILALLPGVSWWIVPVFGLTGLAYWLPLHLYGSRAWGVSELFVGAVHGIAFTVGF